MFVLQCGWFGSLMALDQFTAARKTIAYIDKAVAQEWKRAEPHLKRFVREGDYAAERRYREYVGRAVERLLEERRALRLELPPFTTMKNGIAYRHPVTPENAMELAR